MKFRHGLVAMGAALLLAAPAAHAVYGPEDVSGPNVPGGFSRVVTAKTIGSHGGTLKAKVGKLTARVTLRRGALHRARQIQLVRLDLSAIRRELLKEGYRKYRIIGGIGIGASDPDGTPVSTLGGAASVSIQLSRLPRHPLVLRFDARKGRFVRVSFRRSTKSRSLTVSASTATAFVVLDRG